MEIVTVLVRQSYRSIKSKLRTPWLSPKAILVLVLVTQIFIGVGDAVTKYDAVGSEQPYWIAAKRCRNIGGILAQPKTRAEQNAIVAYLKYNTTHLHRQFNNWWIGLVRDVWLKQTPYYWTFEDGYKLYSGGFWLHGNQNNHNCTRLFFDKKSTSNGWIDTACHEYLPYVCELKTEDYCGKRNQYVWGTCESLEKEGECSKNPDYMMCACGINCSSNIGLIMLVVIIITGVILVAAVVLGIVACTCFRNKFG